LIERQGCNDERNITAQTLKASEESASNWHPFLLLRKDY